MKIPLGFKRLMGEKALQMVGLEYADPIMMLVESVVVEVILLKFGLIFKKIFPKNYFLEILVILPLVRRISFDFELILARPYIWSYYKDNY